MCLLERPIPPHHFHDFGMVERLPDSQHQYYLSLVTLGYFKASKKQSEISFWKIFHNSPHFAKSNFMEKTDAGQSCRSAIKFLENLEYGINIGLKTWNGHLVIRDICFPKNMKFNFDSVVMIFISNAICSVFYFLILMKLWRYEVICSCEYLLWMLHNSFQNHRRIS